ncbi:pca operon transcription factor PcaQ [Piscinibacter sp. XHJ-5]|uniref:pca operon transcription factor PcaQ n=1 Tax=Piscinibacter sp. XHJ-5 TaxID=3037797 RepID=UPI002452AECE|nr:pca operon transcription factor PcaQ [Piscinibacter sp. XHJ-5]
MPSRDATLVRIRLRHLQCFLAVAQLGNLRRAAQALAVTQPAVTKTLNELEDMLGTPLFVRGRKGALMTPEAELFLPHASASVAALNHAVDSVLLSPAEAPLRIGMLPTLGPSFMPAVLQRFAAQRPQAVVRLHSGRNKQLIEQLRQRELDVVVGRLSDPDAMLGITFEHLYAEPLVVVMKSGHPAAGGSAAALGAWPLVLPLAGTMIRQLADGFLERHGVRPLAGVVETLDTSLARSLLLAGEAVWFTPLGAARPELDTGRFARLAVQITPEEPVGLMLAADAAPPPALQALVAAIRQQAAEWREPGRKPRHRLNRR